MAGTVAMMASVMALLLLCAARRSVSTSYVVGDRDGWGTGVDYANWASGKTFAVGDTLVFNYGPGAHSVAEVSADGYAGCSTSGASEDRSGATTVALSTPGTHYFVCGVPGHCAGGMKLAVPVQPNATATSPPGAGGGPPPAVTSPTTTTAVPSSSATVSPVAVVVVAGLAMAKWAAPLL